MTGLFDALQLGPRLGEGGMGAVYRGTLGRRGTPVALKVLNEQGLQSRAAQLAFSNEVRAVAALNHPGVVPILDYGALPEGAPAGLRAGSPYLVMPLARGGTAADLKGRLTWPELQGLLLGVLDALAHAHARGVLHRDLKPSNILMLDANDPSSGPWLADFGIASLDRTRYPDAAPLHGGGTLGFRAPEQHEPGLDPQGPWTDLYALGVVAAVLADAWGTPLDAPRPFWDLVARMTASDPRARPRFAAEAAQALSALAPLRRHPSPTPSWVEEPERSPLEPSMSLRVLTLREPGLVGRGEAREALWRALGQALEARRPVGARVLAPPGLGRSRLGRWLAEQAHQQGLARGVVVGLTPGPSARDPIAGALAHVLGLEGLRRAGRRELLASLFAPRGWSEGELDRLEELLVRVPGAGLAVRVDRQAHRAGLLRRAVLDLARAHPLVLVLDDLHHDRDTAALVDSLLNGAGDADAALFLLTTATPEGQARLPRAGWTPAVELALEPLSPSEHLHLVRELLGHRRAQLGAVAARSAGDPGFAVQLVRSLREGERPPERLPEALQDVFSLRLTRALSASSPPERRAVYVAALLGVQPDLEEWRRACGLASVEASEHALEALSRAGLLLRGAERLRFVTPLVRDTLVALCADTGEAPALLRACAAALHAPQEPERVALLLLQAGDDAAALAPLTEAVERSVARHQNLDRAAELGAHLEALLGRLALPGRDQGQLTAELTVARLHISLGEPDRAWATLPSVVERAERAGAPELALRARRFLARRRFHEGDYEAHVRELEALLDSAVGELRGDLLREQAFGLRALGRGDEAMEVAARATRLCEDAGDEVGVLDLLRLQAGHLSEARPEAATLALAAELRARAAKLGYAYFIGIGWNISAIVHDRLGDLQAAIEDLRRAQEVLDAIGAPDRVAPRINRGVLLTRMGRYGEARGLLEAGYRELALHRTAVEIGFALIWWIRALAGQGDWASVEPGWRDGDVSMVRVRPPSVMEPLLQAHALAREQGAAEALAVLRALLSRAAALCPDLELKAQAEAALDSSE